MQDGFETAHGAEVLSVANRLEMECIPSGFCVLPGGVYEQSADNDSAPAWLCSPVAVVARFRDASGKGWGRILEIEDPEGRWQRISLFDKDFEARPSAIRAELVNLGLRTQSGPKTRDALNRLLRGWQPTKIMTSTDRLGWSDASCAAFMRADGRVLGSGAFHFVGGGLENTANSVAVGGSAEEWRDNVASLCVGNPLMMVSVSLAFARPLLDLLSEEGGGLHLRGASSCGKTTMQRVATSVWRNPAQVGSWRTTSNAVEVAAKTANSTLLSLDEIAEIDGRHLYEATYRLANGVGKARSNALGGARQTAAWRITILSTGEISVAEKLAEAGLNIMAGQDIRPIDLEADCGRHGAFDDLHGCENGAELSDRLKRASAQSYGTAGPAFVEKVIPHRAKIAVQGKTVMDRVLDRWCKEFSLRDYGQVLRVARRLALIGFAGVLASKLGMTGWPIGAPLDAAKVALGLWLDGRDSAPENVDYAAKARTRAFLIANESGFAEPDSSETAVNPGAHGWKQGDQFLISGDAWHTIHGAESGQTAPDLKVAGLLVPADGNNLGRRAPRWAECRPRVYVVRRRILEDSVPTIAEEAV
ncbi:MAG: DUF927 domain-containing protein [Rhodobacteraceae bacterium]|nr:DUF927 domain-containing protein [Paracoccaceae bacterium]